MGTSQQFSLRWNNYLRHIRGAFDSLRTDEDLVDVTLSCEGRKIRAHKMLLSACSTYFRDLFKENPCQHPVIIFKDVKFVDLKALIDFMYQGEVNVVQDQLSSFLLTAELLAVQGLTDGSSKVASPSNPHQNETKLLDLSPSDENRMSTERSSDSPPLQEQPDSPPTKKQRSNVNSGSSSAGSDASGTSVSDVRNTDEQSVVTSLANEYKQTKPEDIRPADMIKVEMPDYLDNDSVELCENGEEVRLVENLTSASRKPPVYFPSRNSQDINHHSVNPLLDISRVMDLCGPSTGLISSREHSQDINSIATLRLSDRYLCKFCDKTFNTLPILERHVAARHQLQDEMFYCALCARYFKTKWSLSTHNSRYHKTK